MTHYNNTTQKSILKVPYDCYYFDNKFDDEVDANLNNGPGNTDSKKNDSSVQNANQSVQSSKNESTQESTKSAQGSSHEHQAILKESKQNDAKAANAKSDHEAAASKPFDYQANGHQDRHESTQAPVEGEQRTSKSPIGPKLKTSTVKNPKQTKQSDDKPKLSIKKLSVPANAHQRKTSDDQPSQPTQPSQSKNVRKKRPRSNDDKVKENSNPGLAKPKQRKLSSRDNSEKTAKDSTTNEAIQKR